MSVSITATEQTTPSPSAVLTVDGLTVGTDATITVQRSWAGESADVRSAVDLPVTGATMAFTDWECPFVTTSYSVTVRDANGGVTGRASSSAIVLSVDRPWISDPLAPAMAAPIKLVTDSLSHVEYSRDGTVSQPIGSTRPVLVAGKRRAPSNIPMTISCSDKASRAAVLSVLTSADPICLRLPDTTPYLVLPPMAYMTYDVVSEERLAMWGSRVETRFLFTGTTVRAPGSTIAASVRTYDDVKAEASTYGDLVAMYADYNALLLGATS